MKLDELKHVVRASSEITHQKEFVVVGSQAALVERAVLPGAMAVSCELDIYPLREPELAEAIDGAIGEQSQFHITHGYYAQGVGPETAKLPAGWEKRAKTITSGPPDNLSVTAPEIADICASKLVAFRDKDREYVKAAIDAGFVTRAVLQDRLDLIPEVDSQIVEAAKQWVGR